MEKNFKVKCKIKKIMKFEEFTGFIIARAEPVDTKEYNKYLNMYGNFSILGTGFLIEEVEYILSGKKIEKNNWGYTFHFDEYEKSIPNDIEGLQAYLQTFKGIGPTLAKNITDKFGLKALDIMEKESHRLLEIKGMSKEKLSKIKEKFIRNESFEKLARSLTKYGISTSKCVKIYDKLGDGAEKEIHKNPYILCDQIDRISFLTCDYIAKKLNFPMDSYFRLEAAIIHLVKEYCYNKGHLFIEEQVLAKAFRKYLPNIDMCRFEEVLDNMEKQKKIVREDENSIIYLTKINKMERYVSMKIMQLCTSCPTVGDLDKLIEEVEKDNNITYDEKQKEAINMINSGSNVNIITGGPGTGKSTIIKAMISIFYKTNPQIRIELAAPTGRAAKRMEEATGVPASTVHRKLEYNPFENRFTRNANNPLDCDVLFIDESSMLDMELFCNLINAINKNIRVYFIGDTDQLPPVGLGYIFRDLIQSNLVPVTKLNKVFRQGEGSVIKVNAQNINKGITTLEREVGAFEITCYKKDELRRDIIANQKACLQIFKTKLAEQRKINAEKAIYQVQILTPMKKGELGTNKLNSLIQEMYNPIDDTKRQIVFHSKDKKEEFIYRTNDKVMQITNDYDKNVFNGDMGIIVSVEKNSIEVRFENDEIVSYEKSEIRESLILAYAITVHKSQGSEYANVIFISSYLHSFMRQRNLFYTAVTRAKKSVNLLGDVQSIAISIKTYDQALRNSKVKERMIEIKEKQAA